MEALKKATGPLAAVQWPLIRYPRRVSHSRVHNVYTRTCVRQRMSSRVEKTPPPNLSGAATRARPLLAARPP
jgi:hypothetical protein